MTQLIQEFDTGTGVKFTATRHSNTGTNTDLYDMVGEIDHKAIAGQLVVYLKDGEFNGYDWEGTELTEDELQVILDLFADVY